MKVENMTSSSGNDIANQFIITRETRKGIESTFQSYRSIIMASKTKTAGCRHTTGGVGTSCYYDIAEFIGGKFEKISSGKTFDVFQYTNKSKN